MGIKILKLRHRTPPPAGGCRWCGFPEMAHGVKKEPKPHFFELPTDQQRRARLTAKGSWLMPGVANDARSQL